MTDRVLVPLGQEETELPTRTREKVEDQRQGFRCIDVDGLASSCPPFRSNNHLGGIPVTCPNCGGGVVIRADTV